MTDLLNGKIDFFGYEVNPNTTLDDFEKAIGDKFTKFINPKNADIISFRLNGEAALYSYHPEFETVCYSLYDMNFINAVARFYKGKISEVCLYTNMHSFELIDEKRKYSDRVVKERFEKLNDWCIRNFGEPNFNTKSAIRYHYNWGNFHPSVYDDSGVAKVYIQYEVNKR